MGWIEDLKGKVIALDTSPFIYYIERQSPYVDMMHSVFQAVEQGEFTLVTSIVSLLETLVVPMRHNNVHLVDEYRDILFNNKGLTTIMLDPNIAEGAARLRASYTIRTPDAIQMATAIHAGAAFFLTNDIKLPAVPNLTTLVLDKLKES